MGTSNFFKPMGSKFQPSQLNMEARAGNAGSYSGRAAGVGAQKDIGAAQGLYTGHKFSTPNDAAAHAPGPRKV